MSGVVHVCSRWGDYTVAVHDLRRGEGWEPFVRFFGEQPEVLVAPGITRSLVLGETCSFERDGLEHAVTWWEGPEVGPWHSVKSGWWLAALTIGWLVAATSIWLAPRADWLRSFEIRPLPQVTRKLVVSLAPDSAIEHETTFSVAALPQQQPERVTGEMRCGDAQPGVRFAEPIEARWAVAGPRDNPDPHLARSTALHPGHLGQSDPYWGLGFNQDIASGSHAPTAPWGRDTELGVEDISSNGHMFADNLGGSDGEHGLGRQPTPGGLAKRLDITAAAGGDQARVIQAGLRVSGARKPSQVGRVMAARFDELSRCVPHDSASRTIELRFNIAETGAPTLSTTPGDAVESCLSGVLSGVEFGAAATGSTDVVYPLHVVAPSSGLSVSPPSAAPSAKCDCG